MNKSGFIYGAIILAIVNFIVRIIGFSYRIILSKTIGPEGIGLFQMVHPVLMFFVTITTAGIPVAISKLVAKHNAVRNHNGVKAIFRVTLVSTLAISIALSLSVVIFNEYISNQILNNKDVAESIIFLSPAIILISLSSVVRGYFYGLKKISPAGISQIIEQIARIAFVLGFLYYLGPLSSRKGALVAVIGISIGESFGLIWLLISYLFLNRKSALDKPNALRTAPGFTKILSQVSYIAIPITISRIVNVVLQLLNAILIPQRLVVAGYSSKEAVAIFGRVTGMAMPIIFLPFIVTSALVVNIIPNLSEDVAHKNYRIVSKNINLAVRITLMVSIPLTAMFAFFGTPLAIFFYGDATVGKYIEIMGYSTIFFSLQHTLSGILHGIGKQIAATVNYIVGMSVQLLATYFLVANPSFGISGFFIGFLASTLIICVLNYISVVGFKDTSIKLIDYIIKPVFSSVICVAVMLFIYKYLSSMEVKSYITFTTCFTSGGIIYFIALFITKGLPPQLVKSLINKI